MPRIIDLSHEVSDGLQTYPGLPVPHVFEHLTRDAAEEALEAQRQALQQAEREVHETAFAEKECAGKIAEIDRSLQSLVDPWSAVVCTANAHATEN